MIMNIFLLIKNCVKNLQRLYMKMGINANHIVEVKNPIWINLQKNKWMNLFIIKYTKLKKTYVDICSHDQGHNSYYMHNT